MYGYICIIKFPKLAIYYRVKNVPFKNSYLTNPTVVSHSVLPDSLWPHEPNKIPLSMGFCKQVGCHSLLQGIFPIQGSNPGLLHCRQIFYHLRHQGAHKPEVKVSSLCILLGFQTYISIYVYTYVDIYVCIYTNTYMWNILCTN